MEIRFTEYVRKRMTQRGIPEEVVRHALAHGSRRASHVLGRTLCTYRLSGRRRIRVVYETHTGYWLVITVY